MFAMTRAETNSATAANTSSMIASASVPLLSVARLSVTYSCAGSIRMPSGSGPTSPRTARLPTWKPGWSRHCTYCCQVT